MNWLKIPQPPLKGGFSRSVSVAIFFIFHIKINLKFNRISTDTALLMVGLVGIAHPTVKSTDGRCLEGDFLFYN